MGTAIEMRFLRANWVSRSLPIANSVNRHHERANERVQRPR